MSDRFDPYHKWLGIPPAEQPPNHYRLLGLALFERDADVIANAADRQMAHIRSFQNSARASVSQQMLNEIAAAKLCLLRAETKVAYDAQLQAKMGPVTPPPVTMEFPEPDAQPILDFEVEHRSRAPGAKRRAPATRAPRAAAAPEAAADPAALAPDAPRPGLFTKAWLLSHKRLLAGVAVMLVLLAVWVLQRSRHDDVASVADVSDSEFERRMQLTKEKFAQTTNAPTAAEYAQARAEANMINEPRPALESGGAYAVRLVYHDRIELPEDLGFTAAEPAFTLEGWIKLDLSRADIYLFGNSYPENPSNSFEGWYAAYVVESRGSPIDRTYNSASYNSGCSMLSPLRDWAHYCMATDGKTVTTFLNGEPLGTGNITRKLKDLMSSKLSIGRSKDFADRNKASSFDIRAFRLSKGVRYTSAFKPSVTFTSDEQTRVLLDFSSGTGSHLADRSGHNLHGKAVGGRWLAVPRSEMVKSETPPLLNTPVSPVAGAATLRLAPGDYVEVENTADIVTLHPSYTAEAWARSVEPEKQVFVIGNVFDTEQSPANGGFVTWFDGAVIGASGTHSGGGSGKQVPSRWHHFCLIRDPIPGKRDGRFVIDGGIAYSFETKDFNVGPSANFTVGLPTPTRKSSLFTKFPAGTLEVSAFRLSKGARYSGTIKPVFDFKADADTIAVLDFSTGTGAELRDLTGTGHTGKITGGRWVVDPKGKLIDVKTR